LQQVAFATGMIVDASRVSRAQIFPFQRLKTMRIVSHGRKFAGDQNVALRPLVTGVRVTGHNFAQGSEFEEITKIEYRPGTHTITFKAPVHDVRVVRGAVLLSATVNQAVVEVTTSGEVILEGILFIDSLSISEVHSPFLGVGDIENVVSIEEATLVSSRNATEIAERIYEHYQMRHVVETKYIFHTEETGSDIRLEVFRGMWLRGFISDLSIDLSGGFVTRIKALGSPDDSQR
jgi:hypothetical protein